MVFFFKQKTAYEMRISDWSSDVCSSDLLLRGGEIDLLEIIVDRLDHLDNPPETKITGLRVELGADVVLGAVAGARGTLDRFLDRLDDDPLVDHLLAGDAVGDREQRSEEHTSELQSLLRISYAVSCLKKKRDIKR